MGNKCTEETEAGGKRKECEGTFGVTVAEEGSIWRKTSGHYEMLLRSPLGENRRASCLHHLEVRVAVARVVVRTEARMEPTRVSEREEMTRCRLRGKIGVKKRQQQQLDELFSAFTNISLYTSFPLSTPVIVYNTLFSPFPLVFTETPSMPVQRELFHSGERGKEPWVASLFGWGKR